MHFVGQFRDNQFDGQGKLYEMNGSVSYEGQFRANRYDGFGKLYVNNQIVYEGQFRDGKYHGTGKQLNDVSEVIEEGTYEYGVCVASTLEKAQVKKNSKQSTKDQNALSKQFAVAFDDQEEEEAEEKERKSLEELLGELEKLIGLESVKKDVRPIIDSYWGRNQFQKQ